MTNGTNYETQIAAELGIPVQFVRVTSAADGCVFALVNGVEYHATLTKRGVKRNSVRKASY